MGLFAEWQPRYAEQGVATFPLIIEGKNKKPATKGYARTGLKGSGQLALRFPDVSALAFMAGKNSGVTIIDIDAPDDEDLLREVLARYGDTPLISRTGSGGFHCYYGYAGESRKIRMDPTIPVDKLGGGVVAAPPSKGSRGDYGWIRGGLADLHRLPFIREDARRAEVRQTVERELVQHGSRNGALLKYLRSEARHTDDLESLIDVGMTYANDCMDRVTGHPFTDAEVQAVARSVWDWTERKIAEGNYRVGVGRYMTLAHEKIDQVLLLGADAVMLFIYLQRRSDHRKSLIVANDMAKTMPDGEWPRKRFAKARQALIDGGILRETRPASTYHGPATYAW